jgi:transcriptional regulator with XRE-family HTH domain
MQVLNTGSLRAKSETKKVKRPHWNDPVVRAAFASIIVQRRRKLRLRQREVADRSGYSEKYIGMLKRRKHTPSLTAAIMISRGLEYGDLGELTNEVRSLMPRFKRLEGKGHEAADM